jgi:hypothetical protein
MPALPRKTLWRRNEILKATETTGDLTGLSLELLHFISEAQSDHHHPSRPLAVYVGQLRNILLKHIDAGAYEP